ATRLGAPPLFLRTTPGLQPSGDQLVTDPALPNTLGRLACRTFPDAGDSSTPTAAASSRWTPHTGCRSVPERGDARPSRRGAGPEPNRRIVNAWFAVGRLWQSRNEGVEGRDRLP